MKCIMASLAIGALFLTAGVAFADSSGTTPGGAGAALGSPFNSSGTATTVYAGNPGTASLANSNSTAAVAQYDVACFQNNSQIP